MTVMEISQALMNLRPGAQWTLRGPNLSELEWMDEEQTRPTDAEIEAEVARMKA